MAFNPMVVLTQSSKLIYVSQQMDYCPKDLEKTVHKYRNMAVKNAGLLWEMLK